MNKFSKIIENFLPKKFYKATCKVELVIQSENEGEAGHIIDSDLGGLENLSDFKIIDISEISKDEFKKITLQESYLNNLGKSNESIIISWENKFGDNKNPSQIQKMEFYHLLRQLGHDKETIMDALKGRL